MKWTMLLAALLAPASATAADADPWFSRDKALHFGVSALISSDAYLATRLAHGSRPMALAIGGGSALVLGAAKEIYDLTGRGDPSWKDVAWDVLGTGTGLLAAWAFDRFIVGDPKPEAHALRIGDWNLAFAVRVGR